MHDARLPARWTISRRRFGVVVYDADAHGAPIAIVRTPPFWLRTATLAVPVLGILFGGAFVLAESGMREDEVVRFWLSLSLLCLGAFQSAAWVPWWLLPSRVWLGDGRGAPWLILRHRFDWGVFTLRWDAWQMDGRKVASIRAPLGWWRVLDPDGVRIASASDPDFRWSGIRAHQGSDRAFNRELPVTLKDATGNGLATVHPGIAASTVELAPCAEVSTRTAVFLGALVVSEVLAGRI
ncbi:MAG: hypothetical protein ACK595_04365 [Planctomycetota bacterium]